MKVKCKICQDKIERDTAFKIVKEYKGKNVNHYYCNEEEYNNMIKAREQKEKCYETVRVMLGIPMITPAWVKNINTISEFYDYIVIEKCFKENESSIVWSINNKDFSSEYNKAKYILSIIANNIEDTKRKHLKDIEDINLLFNKQENNNIDIDIINEENHKRNDVTDISAFL